jgi:hypothetical protein
MTDSSAVESHEWDSRWDEETILLAYEASKELPATFSAWADAVDNKVVATFSVGAVLVVLLPALQQQPPTPAATIFLGLALGFWVFAAVACYRAYRPVGLRVEPNPRLLLNPKWLELSPKRFRYWRLHWLGKTFTHNSDQLARKTEHLGQALILTAAEVFCLLLSLVLGRAGL